MSTNSFINFCYSSTHRLNMNSTKCLKRISLDLRNQNDKLVQFSLYLTDDNDPYYLFLCELDHEGYTLYKENYNINIPFDQFPRQIIKFLKENQSSGEDNVSSIELHVVEDSKRRPSGHFIEKEATVQIKENVMDSSMPLDYTKRFSRSPNVNESTPNRYNALDFTRQSPQVTEEILFFKIVEKNDFRALTLVKMKIKKANNNDMKHFFNTRINKLISHIDGKNASESRQLEKIATLEDRIEQMQVEMNRLNAQIRDEKDQMRRSVEQKYEQLMREKDNTIEKMNGKMQELQLDKNRMGDEKKQAHSVIAELKEKNKAIPELNERIRSKNKKIESYETDVKVYQNKSKKLQQDLNEQEKFISSLRMRLAVLEQESGDKQVLIDKLQDMIKLTKEKKHQLESNMKNNEEINTKRHECMNVLKKELMKANEIISKLSLENVDLNKKLADVSGSYKNMKHLFNGQLAEIKEYKEKLDLKENDLSNLMESKNQIYTKFMNAEHELKQKMEKLQKYERSLNAIKSYLEKVEKNSKQSTLEQEIIRFLKDLLVTT